MHLSLEDSQVQACAYKTLQPLEFTDLTNAITDSEIEKETGIKKDSDSVEKEDVDTQIEE